MLKTLITSFPSSKVNIEDTKQKIKQAAQQAFELENEVDTGEQDVSDDPVERFLSSGSSGIRDDRDTSHTVDLTRDGGSHGHHGHHGHSAAQTHGHDHGCRRDGACGHGHGHTQPLAFGNQVPRLSA